ncbi:hypothetical protein IQ06DRAFT_16 [Phaeosphaeriaceae sp. SRC1lsM3a]|nr:hypothetical protein IQ06DRAFT_16 [Stagonospora sp. SRC1lsM3a]
MQRSTPLGDANDAFEHLGIDNLSESLVNGIWNHVLSQLFPFPDFLILPEHWTDSRRPGGSRVDLVVYRMRDMGPVFVYEGKGDVEDLSLKEPSQALDVIISAGLQKNLAQIQRYLRTLRRSQGESSFGVLAQGTQFIIMKYDAGQYWRVRETSLLGDEQVNVFHDFASDRFDRKTADSVLGEIARRLK